MLAEYSAADRSLYEAMLDTDGRAAVASILRGADPCLVIRRRPVIHYAIYMRDKRLLQCLIDNGADVNAVSEEEGLAPLHVAIKEKFVGGLEILLKTHVDVDLRCNEGFPPLFHAVRTRNRQIFEMLLAGGADANARDNGGRTTLHVTNYHWQVVGLLERGADVNARDNRDRTPLQMELWASFCPHSYTGNPVVTEMLRWGADVDLTTLDAVFILARDKECELELLRTVFRGTGLVHARDGCWRTALHYVAGTDRVGAVRELLDCGADVNARDSEGCTPLHFAVGFNAGFEVVSELILEGAHLNVIGNRGRTPLHLGVISSGERVVELLLREGADVNVLDQKFESPLDRLIRRKHAPCMLSLLLKHSVWRNYDSRTQYVESGPWRKDFLSCIRYMGEIEDMKRVRVGEGLNLFDIALGEEWDITFTRTVHDKMRTGKLPVYSDIALQRLSRKVKEHFTGHANDVSSFLLDLARKSPICINQHALIDIAKNLSDEDCLNFYLACC